MLAADRWQIDDEMFVFAYGGETFRLDMTEEGTFARYTEAVQALGALSGQTISEYCAGIRALLDTLLGDGAGVQLVGTENSLYRAHNCFASLIACISDQLSAVRAQQEALRWAFSPERAERGGHAAESVD